MNESVEGYLLVACQKIGWVMGGGMGPSPLTYSEIRAYGGGLVEQWEFDILRSMSLAYLHGLEAKVDPATWDCYTGILLPLVMPNDRDVARIMFKSFEASL